ncbi:MAG: type VI secretion system protein TssA [Gemmataceae bacterium]
MSIEPVLAIDELLEPIPGDNPAGTDVPFDVREQLKEMRKEINPQDYAADDPTRPTEHIKANWPGIVRLAEETLRDTSKNVLVAAQLAEALVKIHGFVGLRDGLQFMRRLMAECWDRITPDIEDGDLEVRATPFKWLDDEDRGARFPTTIRLVPIVYLGTTGFGWFRWKHTQAGQHPVEEYEQAVLNTSRDLVELTVESLETSEEELRSLIDVLTDKLGDEAPALNTIQLAVTDCLTLSKQILERKGPGEDAPIDEEEAEVQDEESEDLGETPQATRRKIRNRDDIYAVLNEAAGRLKEIEPHSPIPYLIEKAVELGAMPFPQLMRALIRDDNILREMNRELGIKEESEEQQY